MIDVRVARRFPAGDDSVGFALDIRFQASGGITVLFGPSGAGKTLTLDMIAGFVRPDSGRILLDDSLLFDGEAGVHLPPRRRNCGYVFQNDALFPHMSLRSNLLFGAARKPRRERHLRAAEMLEHFELADVAGRRPHEVSGGQRQRCSIARALIGEPRLLLLDEPSRGLDAPLRAGFHELLHRVRAEFNSPILLVTHDLDEAFALGNSMIVVAGGRVVQSGTPAGILDQPASLEVARLLGIANLFEAEIVALDPGRNASRLRTPAFELAGSYFPGHFRGDRVWAAVRSEDVRVHPGDAPPPPNSVRARLERVSERSRGLRLEFAGGLSADVSRREFQSRGAMEEWLLEIPPHAIRVL